MLEVSAGTGYRVLITHPPDTWASRQSQAPLYWRFWRRLVQRVHLDRYGASAWIHNKHICYYPKNWRICTILDSQLHGAILYIQIGLMAALYINILFSMERCDFLPISRFNLLIFQSICFHFLIVRMWTRVLNFVGLWYLYVVYL